jgi:hypothetical protein
VPRPTPAALGLNRWQAVLGHCYAVHHLFASIAPQSWLPTREQCYRTIAPEDSAAPLACRLLDRLAELVRPHGTPVAIALLWGSGDVMQSPQWPGAALIGARARANGFAVVDVYEPLHRVAIEDPEGFKPLWELEGGQLGHPSAAGNRLIVRELQATLFGPLAGAP